MSRLRIFLLGISAIMLVLLTVGLYKFQQFKKNPVEVLDLLPENTDVSLNQVHQTSTREGVKEWNLDAASVTYQKKGGRSLLKDVSVTFFLKNGKTVHVTGKKGVVFTQTKDMELSGNVVVQTEKYTLKTDRLTYRESSRSIDTDTPVALTGGGVTLTGKNLAVSFANEQIEVGGGVTAIVEEFTL